MRVGAMFRCLLPPERLIQFARLVDGLGLDELWLVEDCFWAGGIASTATALAVTERVRVGLGVAPAVVRNPAVPRMVYGRDNWLVSHADIDDPGA